MFSLAKKATTTVQLEKIQRNHIIWYYSISNSVYANHSCLQPVVNPEPENIPPNSSSQNHQHGQTNRPRNHHGHHNNRALPATCASNLPQLQHPHPTRLLQQLPHAPHNPELHDPNGRPDGDRPRRDVHLRGEVRRRDPPRAEAYRGRDCVDGEFGAGYERQSVFYYAGADAVAGWETYDFWAGEERDGSGEKVGVGEDRGGG
ncbi:hypothetical protein ACMFMF_005289 [Clarireedia jacksonii]